MTTSDHIVCFAIAAGFAIAGLVGMFRYGRSARWRMAFLTISLAGIVATGVVYGATP